MMMKKSRSNAKSVEPSTSQEIVRKVQLVIFVMKKAILPEIVSQSRRLRKEQQIMVMENPKMFTVMF